MAAFATSDDVQTRLGRDLTDDETAQVEAVLDSIAGMIRSEVGKADDWDPDPIPSTLSELSIQKAILSIVNPNNLAARTLGSFSETFQRAQDGGLLFSADEGRRLRRAVYGSSAGTARMRSHVDTTLDLLDDGEINDSIGS